MKKIENLEQNFDYNGAIEAITEFLGTNSNKFTDKDFMKQIYLKLAQNYTKINNFEGALDNFSNAAAIAKTYKIRQGLLI